jgi:hypothetical protein
MQKRPAIIVCAMVTTLTIAVTFYVCRWYGIKTVMDFTGKKIEING